MSGMAAPIPAPEWRAFRHRLTEYVRPRINDPADAEDVVQDILIRAVDHLPTLKSGERLTPWLDAISRNAVIDFYRRKSRAPLRVALEAAPEPPVEESEEGDRKRAALIGCIRPMMSLLPPIYREAVTRVDLEGQRQVDVARDLGLGISALKSRVQRGRALLLQVLSDCCHFERDAAGRVVDYHPRGDSCVIDSVTSR
jgi:RNA polymerase sigma-70 factor, ECF subfamily